MKEKNGRQDIMADHKRQALVKNQDTAFIGRQPILDRRDRIIGFELLFRSADCLEANVTDISMASMGVITDILSNISLQDMIGKEQKGFLNVGVEVLLSDIIELIPKERMVIELLETIEINHAVVERCRELKAMGFHLALDDFLYDPVYDPLLEIVDIVKIDLLQMTPSSLRETVERLKRHPVKLLAEKVEERRQYDAALALGFELFQGYYFARPTVVKGKRFDPARVSVLKLMEQILVDADVREIEQTFKENPFFSYNLLRIVNSVALGMRGKIESLRQAVVILGRDQLKRWAELLLFSDNNPGQVSPLMQTAAMRGRLMELLAGTPGGGGQAKENIEAAFMTGILSLIDSLLETPMEEVLDQLSLTDTVKEALLAREGQLGKLLALIEKLEQGDLDGILRLLEGGNLELCHLFAAEQQAIAWTNNLVDAF